MSHYKITHTIGILHNMHFMVDCVCVLCAPGILCLVQKRVSAVQCVLGVYRATNTLLLGKYIIERRGSWFSPSGSM